MITATRMMKPLPILPIDRVGAGNDGPQPPYASASRVKHPLPMPPRLDPTDLAGAVRNAAYERMLARLNIMQPLPVLDPMI